MFRSTQNREERLPLLANEENPQHVIIPVRPKYLAEIADDYIALLKNEQSFSSIASAAKVISQQAYLACLIPGVAAGVIEVALIITYITSMLSDRFEDCITSKEHYFHRYKQSGCNSQFPLADYSTHFSKQYPSNLFGSRSDYEKCMYEYGKYEDNVSNIYLMGTFICISASVLLIIATIALIHLALFTKQYYKDRENSVFMMKRDLYKQLMRFSEENKAGISSDDLTSDAVKLLEKFKKRIEVKDRDFQLQVINDKNSYLHYLGDRKNVATLIRRYRGWLRPLELAEHDKMIANSVSVIPLRLV